MGRGTGQREGAGTDGDATGGLADLLTPRRIGVVALLVVFGIWCSANADSVRVSFLVADREVPLFVALLVAGLIGLAVGYLAGRRTHD